MSIEKITTRQVSQVIERSWSDFAAYELFRPKDHLGVFMRMSCGAIKVQNSLGEPDNIVYVDTEMDAICRVDCVPVKGVQFIIKSKEAE